MVGVPREHVRVSRVVGETDEGLTLFVPKDENGVFHLEGGERFLTMMFVRHDDHESALVTWLPWEDGESDGE